MLLRWAMPGRLSLALGPQGPLVKRDLEILPDALREHVNALAADIGPRTLLDRAFCPAARSAVGHKQTLWSAAFKFALRLKAVRSGDIVHYRVEKIRNRGRVWRYRGQASLYQLTPEGAVALARWSTVALTQKAASHCAKWKACPAYIEWWWRWRRWLRPRRRPRWWSWRLRYAVYPCDPSQLLRTRVPRSLLALLGCHHKNTARHEGDPFCSHTSGIAVHLGMLGDGLGALEPFFAFLATILISRHGSAHHDARLPQPNGKACLRWRLAPGNCHTHTSRASLSDALS